MSKRVLIYYQTGHHYRNCLYVYGATTHDFFSPLPVVLDKSRPYVSRIFKNNSRNVYLFIATNAKTMCSVLCSTDDVSQYYTIKHTTYTHITTNYVISPQRWYLNSSTPWRTRPAKFASSSFHTIHITIQSRILHSRKSVTVQRTQCAN